VQAVVRVTADGGLDVAVEVPPEGSIRVPLPAGIGLGAHAVHVAASGETGVIARLQVPVLRAWSRPPPSLDSPVTLEVTWPENAHAEKVAMLRILVRQSLGHDATVDMRIPMPPGVALAAPVGTGPTKVRQLQGVLAVSLPVDTGQAAIELPLRFGLAGHLVVPEASARIARASYAAARAPASAVDVR
jgi:hypothetical protein